VRNDYPLLACVELGVRHARVPAADLRTAQQRERLAALRDEGVTITAMWIWSERTPVVEEANEHRDLLDGVEIQLPSALLPDAACVDVIRQCAELGLPVTLAPLLPREIVPGKQHARTRIGYHLDELAKLDGHLVTHGVEVARVLARVDATEDPWTTIGATREQPAPAHIGAIDWAVEFLDADPVHQTPRATAALATVATLPGSRLFLEPLVDFDRTMDTPPGLLDRLCNPRPVFHALRILNTVLFGAPTQWTPVDGPSTTGASTLALHSEGERLTLFLPDRPGDSLILRPDHLGHDAIPATLRVIDLERGMSREVLANGAPFSMMGATLLHAGTPASLQLAAEGEGLDATVPRP
jgi:hypothetical protein